MSGAARRVAAVLAGLSLGGPVVSRAAAPDPVAPLDAAVQAAEGRLQRGEARAAQAEYQNVLLEGWLLLGNLEKIAGRQEEARGAFARASRAALASPLAPGSRHAVQSLALALANLGQTAEAVELLTRFVDQHPGDASSRRLLAYALAASGRREPAAEQLEAARSAAPDDPAVAFTLAQDYLRLKQVEAADRLFAQVLSQRPMAEAHVLVGRAYRDADERERAREHLRAALALDPGVRHAHYYLGTLILADDETHTDRLERAMAELRAELELAPGDALANDQLGLALIEAGRHEEALPALEAAARAEPRAIYVGHLGRCLLELGRPSEAATSLRRALELAGEQKAARTELEGIHYHLGLALRRLGATQEAASHLAEAKRLAAGRTEASRPEMALFSFDSAPGEGPAPPGDLGPLTGLAPEARLDLARRVTATLARAHFNLGVLDAQQGELSRAAEQFEGTARLDPAFPRVQYSLGVAYFNARRFGDAGEPLERALAEDPRDASLRRLVALAWLNAGSYAKVVELLRDDAGRRTNVELEAAYGVALLRSGRPADAEAVFSRLLAERGEQADWSALLGRALADQGKDERALRLSQRALELDAGVAGARTTQGGILRRQGRLAEAEEALRAEVGAHPGDAEARRHLAGVLAAGGRAQEAALLLRGVLATQPEDAGAQLELGKLLLDHDAATEALPHLESAVRLAPASGEALMALGRAYERLGRKDLAERQFEAARKLGNRR